MSEFKKYVITWTEEHRKEICATSENGALIDAKIFSGKDYTCTKSENFKVEE